jgi:hypothetical protein
MLGLVRRARLKVDKGLITLICRAPARWDHPSASGMRPLHWGVNVGAVMITASAWLELAIGVEHDDEDLFAPFRLTTGPC